MAEPESLPSPLEASSGREQTNLFWELGPESGNSRCVAGACLYANTHVLTPHGHGVRLDPRNREMNKALLVWEPAVMGTEQCDKCHVRANSARPWVGSHWRRLHLEKEA